MARTATALFKAEMIDFLSIPGQPFSWLQALSESPLKAFPEAGSAPSVIETVQKNEWNEELPGAKCHRELD
jgi:hypothetical protein